MLIFSRTIVLTHHLVSSLSLDDCSVHRLRQDSLDSNQSSRNLCTEHSFEKYSNSKLYENLSSGSWFVSCGQKERQTWRSLKSLSEILWMHMKTNRWMLSRETENHVKQKWTILMHIPRIFILRLLQPTNAQISITIFSLSIMFTPTCLDTCVSSSGSFKTCTSISYISS